VARRCTAGLHRAQVLDHAVGQLRAGARSATARVKEIGLLERYERHGLDEVLFALTVGGLSQRKVVDWVRRFLGGTLSPATIGAVLEQAQQQIAQRRSEPIPPGDIVPSWWMEFICAIGGAFRRPHAKGCCW